MRPAGPVMTPAANAAAATAAAQRMCGRDGIRIVAVDLMRGEGDEAARPSVVLDAVQDARVLALEPLVRETRSPGVLRRGLVELRQDGDDLDAARLAAGHDRQVRLLEWVGVGSPGRSR